MRILPLLTLAVSFGLFLPATAQFGGSGAGPGGPNFSGAMVKFFGDHKAFSADVEVESNPAATGMMTVPGKLAVADKKSRFEIDLGGASGDGLPPGMAEQMKQMGMDKLTMLGHRDKQLTYLIYPGLKAYVEMSLKNDLADEAEAKVEITELGKEKLDDQECVKNRIVVTEKSGKTHEAIVWSAVALKKFPLKLETRQNGTPVSMRFKHVKLEKPSADQFEPPKDFTKYDSAMALMQSEMMKRLGGPGN